MRIFIPRELNINLISIKSYSVRVLCNMESLPDEMLESIILHNEVADLLQLRLVSTRIKELVDGSPHLRNVLQDVQINLHVSTLSIFVEQASHLPFTNFCLDLSKKPYTRLRGVEEPFRFGQVGGQTDYDEETPEFYSQTGWIKTLIERVCPEIRRLRVSSMFGCTVKSEYEFFEALKNLRTLEIGELWVLVPGKTVTSDGVKKYGVQGPRIPSKDWNLRELIVDRVMESEEYFLELLKSCPLLEGLKVPRFIEGRLWKDSVVRTYAPNSTLSLLPSVLKFGNCLEHLKVLDTNFQSIEESWALEERTFLQRIVSKTDFRLLRVSPVFLRGVQKVCGLDIERKFRERVVSTEGMSELMQGEGLKNLEELWVCFSEDRSHLGLSGIPRGAVWNFGGLRSLELPALRKISAVLWNVMGLHRQIKDFMELLFEAAEPRTSVREINIHYESIGLVESDSDSGEDDWEPPQKIQFKPSFLDVPFPNVTRLVLKFDVLGRAEVCELVEIISRKEMLEELVLACGVGISVKAFFGRDGGGVPPFLRLKNLRRLRLDTGIHGLCRSGFECGHEKVGRRVVREIIGKLSLTHLEIAGRGWKNVRSTNIRVLERGPCGRSLLWARLPALHGIQLDPAMHPEGLEVVDRLCHANRLAKGLTSSTFEEFKASEKMFTGSDYPFRECGWKEFGV